HEDTKTRSSSALCLFLRFFVSLCSVKIRHSRLRDFQKVPPFGKKAAGLAQDFLFLTYFF
ncbi:MAG: hypothetical protein IJ551_11920, partial [Prevotella sp.]|nr:hypothetical protein [Prevotella sp.]